MTLFVCPTPIGNLEDITLRTLRILQEVDWIAAESTRTTQKLLNHYQIRKKLLSYHEQGNPETKLRKIVEILKSGSSVALVTSAGTPLVNDPGFLLIRQCIRENIPVVPLPGPSALLTALAASGIPPYPFYFGGFLPQKKSARKTSLETIRDFPFTLIFYEAPHRILESLEDCLEILGDRDAVLTRELTKIHEEFIRGKLSDLVARCKISPPKGEITIVLAGQVPQAIDLDTLEGEIQSLLSKGVSVRETSRSLAEKHGISKNKIYALAHRVAGRSPSF